MTRASETSIFRACEPEITRLPNLFLILYDAVRDKNVRYRQMNLARIIMDRTQSDLCGPTSFQQLSVRALAPPR